MLLYVSVSYLFYLKGTGFFFLLANPMKPEADDIGYTSVHSQKADRLCVTLSCGKTPGKSNSREKSFILSHRLKGQSFMVGIHNGRGLKKLFQMHPEAEKGIRERLVLVPSSISPTNHGMLLLRFRLGLHSSNLDYSLQSYLFFQ